MVIWQENCSQATEKSTEPKRLKVVAEICY